MNRGDLERPQMQQQMMAGNYNWLNMNNMHPPSQRPSPFLSSSSTSILPQYSLPTSLPLVSCHGNQELPESLSQLLLSGLVGDENRCSFSHFQSKKMDMSWEDQTLFPSSSVHAVDVKQERPESMYVYGHGNDEFQAIRSQWEQFLPASSPRSCVTNFSSNILDFSHPKVEERSQQPDHSSESIGKATGAPFKKAKVQSSSVQSSTFKVRKEKLGDRITALHQLVSPFGKTDTASVLLEAIGYIRFLQSQIEALSSPYLATAPSGNIRQPVQGERNCIFPEDPGQLLNDTFMKRRGAPEKDAVDGPKKDLRTRGLCLVPISCTQLIGSENGAAFSASNLGGGFQ